MVDCNAANFASLSVPVVNNMANQAVSLFGGGFPDLTAATLGSNFDVDAVALSTNCLAVPLVKVTNSSVSVAQYGGLASMLLQVNAASVAAGSYQLCIRWDPTQAVYDPVMALTVGL